MVNVVELTFQIDLLGNITFNEEDRIITKSLSKFFYSL